MDKFEKTMMSILVFLLIIGSYFLIKLIQKVNQENRSSYYECKQKTQDAEWCFKKFEPSIK